MKRLSIVSVFAFLVFPVLLSAQSPTTSLRATVVDPQHAVVVGANVTLSNASTGFSETTKTDDHGNYQFLQIPPGTFTLTVNHPGFTTVEEEALELLVNVPAISDVSLPVKSETTVVEVKANGIQVNSEDATLGNAFGAEQIESLPFEGRDPTQILSLQPGVTYVGSNVDQNYDSRGGSVSGARSDQTNITLDGVDDNDQVKGYAFKGALRSTLDSLQEFRVTTSNANADEGRSSGAQVVLVTKSGTNNPHGSLYEYNRTNVGYANDWFNKQAELSSGLANKPGQLPRQSESRACSTWLRTTQISPSIENCCKRASLQRESTLLRLLRRLTIRRNSASGMPLAARFCASGRSRHSRMAHSVPEQLISSSRS